MRNLQDLASGAQAQLRGILGAGLLMLCSSAATAGLVHFQATSLGGDLWHYDYTLQGQAPTGGFDGITIYFAADAYRLVNNLVAPLDWDPLVVQPDTGLPADGFVDLLNVGGLLQDMVGPVNFSVNFQFLGMGAPGSQPFELYRTAPFATVLSDQTQSPATVPEPGTAALVGLALGLVLRIRPR